VLLGDLVSSALGIIGVSEKSVEAWLRNDGKDSML
jgi:hypothetical protein